MRAAIGLLLLGAAASGCTALYLFNSGEENLPCGELDALGSPRCKDGFVCVVADDDVERCVKAGFKLEGDACKDDGECEDGFVCADVYADRCDGEVIQPEHQLDCALRDVADKGLRCRRPCKDDFTCGADFRCFDLGDLPPFCQAGTCATDSDCLVGALRGLCVDEGLNGGRSGVCRIQCDPLACNGDAGACACVAEENCATAPDEVLSERAICLPDGAVGLGQPCNGADICVDGATCALFNNGATACVQWCKVTGGAPACDNGGACSGVSVVDPDVGTCAL